MKRLATILFFLIELMSWRGVAAAPWNLTGPLATVRSGHTATLLPSGKVLVAGGSNGSSTLASAELYDPNTGTWHSTGSLAEGRTDHTATVLPSGKVLVAGGRHLSGDAVSSAELYDPSTETWEDPGWDLGTARHGHTATLLTSGLVLVAGGTGGSGSLASAELYYPDMGWDNTIGDLGTPRYWHTATLLPSGLVLVAGGYDGTDYLASAELFDPSTGIWGSTGDFERRSGHTATLLPSGLVLVAGGTEGIDDMLRTSELYVPDDGDAGSWHNAGRLDTHRSGHTATLLPSGHVLLTGGRRSAGDGSSSELYDPIDGWQDIDQDLATSRRFHTATLLPSGDVLLAGGEDFDGLLRSAEVYSITGNWELPPPSDADTPRAWHTATLLPSGSVLVVGGALDGSSSSAEIYDPSLEDPWLDTGVLDTPRHHHTATLLPSGKVLVAGGADGGGSLASTELCGPSTEGWQCAGNQLGTARSHHTATLLPSGKVLAAGGTGSGGGLLPSAELYDPSTGLWENTGSLATPRSSHTATLLPSGKVLVAGGFVSSAELYDPSTGTWESTGGLATPRSGHSATLLPSGEVLVAGGDSSGSLSSAEIYHPSTTSWEPAAPLATERTDHTATLLISGKVLVSGGANDDDGDADAVSEVELYDPSTGFWQSLENQLETARSRHTATLLPSGNVLVAGGWNSNNGELSSAELYRAATDAELGRRPAIQSVSPVIRHGESLTVTGERFGGDSEASSGNTRSSAVNYPLVQVHALEEGRPTWLIPDPRPDFSADPMTLTISNLPILNPGYHLLRVTAAGMSSESRIVELACSIAITSQPEDQLNVPIGSTATFSVETGGGRLFQWQKFLGIGEAGADGDGFIDVAGATEPAYTVPPVTGPESGSRYRVKVDSGCSNPDGERVKVASEAAILTVEDTEDPTVGVLAPDGGEYWLLSEPGGPPNTMLVTWAMSDNIRICEVEVSLHYSDDGGTTWLSAPAAGGLPAPFGPGGACGHGERVTETFAEYTVPEDPPSGSPGSLYRIRVEVTDHAGRDADDESDNPFFIVEPDTTGVKTLILANVPRMQLLMGLTDTQVADLTESLQQLAAFQQEGVVVDLDAVADVTWLYDAWDADLSNAARANTVLFGCHEPFPDWCVIEESGIEKSGIHDHLLNLLEIYPLVEHLVLVGDDRILPMARLPDGATCAQPPCSSENEYPQGDDLSAGTTVGQAAADNLYLSDDPLAVRDPVYLGDLNTSSFLPDLAAGRLVETPEEIIRTIAIFISLGGTLDLSDSGEEHQVLVTGYDYLLDSARRIEQRWENVLGSPPVVNGDLVDPAWNECELLNHLRGDHPPGSGGAPYQVLSLNGHATHYLEGVPSGDPFGIQGLDTTEILGSGPSACDGEPPDLTGRVIYAVGCHAGLPVAGSQDPGADHPLDLPQTFLALGAQAYVANTGYGWALKHGIGYGERLVQILSEELSQGGSVTVGDAVRETKIRYFLERSSSSFDLYAQKSSHQWTYFGLPMYTLILDQPGEPAPPDGLRGPALKSDQLTVVEELDGVRVERRLTGAAVAPGPTKDAETLPPFLIRLELGFDFTAEGVFTKLDASGEEVTEAGCPTPEGCYYTLNGLSTGVADRPIQPKFIYNSQLSGTSQHGVLWQGGTYDQEAGWTPIFAELISNNSDAPDHGSTPRLMRLRPTGPRLVTGADPPGCQPTDLELNSLVVTAGETLKQQAGDATYDVERIYRQADLEVFYLNHQDDPEANCDRIGPPLPEDEGPFAGGDYHLATSATVEWAVGFDEPAEVWRVVVVYDDGYLDADGRGAWAPLELEDDGTGTWRGSQSFPGVSRVTYVIQAVDRHGNVSWLDYVPENLPESGVDPDLPKPVDVEIVLGTADLGLAVSDNPDPVQIGSLLAYTVTAHNLGPDPASSVVVTHTLPAAVGFILASGDGWSCDPSGGIVTCGRDFLGAGETAPPITALLTSPSVADTILNTVSIEALEDDPNPANDTVSEATEVIDGAPPVDGPLIIHSPSPFGYVSLASLGVTSFDCPTTACDQTGWVIEDLDFYWWGQHYDSVSWVTNGYLYLSPPGPATSDNQELPDPVEPNHVLAPFWTDLDLDGGDGVGGGTWYLANLTNGVSTWHVFEWENVEAWNAPGTSYSFQIWIEVGTSNIWFVYGELSPTLAAALTVGVEDGSGGEGFLFYYNSSGAPPEQGSELRVMAPGYCLGVSDLVVSHQVLGSEDVFEACNSLTAGPELSIVFPGDVTFSAGGKVIFKEGLAISEGAIVKVISGPAAGPRSALSVSQTILPPRAVGVVGSE